MLVNMTHNVGVVDLSDNNSVLSRKDKSEQTVSSDQFLVGSCKIDGGEVFWTQVHISRHVKQLDKQCSR